MRVYKYVLFVLLSILIGCSESSVVDPVNESGALDNNYASSLSKKGHDKPIKVHRAKKPIVIDGLKKDWKHSKKTKLKLEIDAAVPSPIEGKHDLSSEVRMLWDDDNLYVFAKIRDQEINVNGFELFERDGFEIYIDGDNSKNVATEFPPVFPPPAYDTNDDFIRFVYGETMAYGTWGYINTANIEFAFMATDKGYDLEIKIPFSSIPGFTAEKGHEFGVEFQTNDNDNDTRENFLKWNSDIDESWFNPSLFGTAVLK